MPRRHGPGRPRRPGPLAPGKLSEDSLVMDWGVLLSTFGLVFVAELGDKTQLAVITQTCRFRRPWPVFFGASIALVMVTAIGAAAGRALATLVDPAVVRYAAAALFIAMGAVIGWQALRSEGSAREVCDPEGDLRAPEPEQRTPAWRAFASTCGLLFVAELGDKTQLAVLGLAGSDADVRVVFAGGALALVAVTALGVLGGEQLSRLIPQRALMRASAAAFVVMGVLMAVGLL